MEGEVVGRTVLRDAVAHHLRCSQLRAEMVVDTLIARGFIRPDETPGAPFAFPAGDWPGGRHPWDGRGGWEGHGVLMLHRPGDRYAVWHFWEEPARRFAGWYLNLQEPFRRTNVGFDTQDLELDVWIPAGGRPRLKDWELLDRRVAEGRFTAAEAETSSTI